MVSWLYCKVYLVIYSSFSLSLILVTHASISIIIMRKKYIQTHKKTNLNITKEREKDAYTDRYRQIEKQINKYRENIERERGTSNA